MPCCMAMMLTWLTCTPFSRGRAVKWGCPWRAHRRYDWWVDVLCGTRDWDDMGWFFAGLGEDGSKQKKRFFFFPKRLRFGGDRMIWFAGVIKCQLDILWCQVEFTLHIKQVKQEEMGNQRAIEAQFLFDVVQVKGKRWFSGLVLGTQKYTKPVILSVQHAHDAWFVFAFAGLNPWFAIKGFW